MTTAEAQARHARLADEIRRHDQASYVLAQPTVRDFEYDRLFCELQDLEKAFPQLATPESPTQRVREGTCEEPAQIRPHRWVIVDTETDGLTAPIHVVEIAAQLMEGCEPCGAAFQIYLNHDVPIPTAATAIHGYTRQFLREHGQSPVSAHETFRQYARDYPLVAHNLAYDWNRALVPEWMSLGLAPIGQRGFCTMLLARRAISGVASFRLDALKSHFRLGDNQSHKALHDVQTVVRLFTTVIKPRLAHAGLTTFREWAEFSRQPIAQCLLQTNPLRSTYGTQAC